MFTLRFNPSCIEGVAGEAAKTTCHYASNAQPTLRVPATAPTNDYKEAVELLFL